jgi:hypothetical protein
MDHFEIASWTDYIHGFVPSAEREVMDRHLREGCEPCRRVAELIRRLQVETAAEEAVPEHLVRAAKAVFRSGGTSAARPDWMSLPLLTAQLALNSLSRPVLAGARSAAAGEAHIVYHAGDYQIDLQIERDPESDELAVVGQVANRAESGRPLAGVPVRLMARAKLIASGESNRFGEFCLVGRALKGLTLRIPLECDGKQVVIPLSKTVGGNL